MKRDKALRFRIAFTVIIILLDFLLLPQVLLIPFNFKQDAVSAIHFSLLGGFSALPIVKPIWVWLQPPVLGFIAWIWLAGRSLVNFNYNSDAPQVAGHGQHGTARWLTEDEIDSYFSVHKL